MRRTHHWMLSSIELCEFCIRAIARNHFDNELTLSSVFYVLVEHRVWYYIHFQTNCHTPAMFHWHCEITFETFHAILINCFEIHLSIPCIDSKFKQWNDFNKIMWHYVRKVKFIHLLGIFKIGNFYETMNYSWILYSMKKKQKALFELICQKTISVNECNCFEWHSSLWTWQ